MDKAPDIAELIENLFKYRGTNCSQVAEKLGMSRQTLFRMIRGGSLKLTLFLRILEEMSLDISFLDDGKTVPEPYTGPTFKKRVKGVMYDSKKLFTVDEYNENGDIFVVCVEPVTETYLLVQYGEKDRSKINVKLMTGNTSF